VALSHCARSNLVGLLKPMSVAVAKAGFVTVSFSFSNNNVFCDTIGLLRQIIGCGYLKILRKENIK
jgi:hypothetical protein